MKKKVVLLSILFAFSLFVGPLGQDRGEAQRAGISLPFQPKTLPPEQYGNIIIDNNASKMGQNPVVFPHWWHRTQFTCKVCHSDIGFKMKAGGSGMLMPEIMQGKWCGKCHNGKIAFPFVLCPRCHSKGIEVKENRNPKDILSKLPGDSYGNRVNWVKAIREGAIQPKASLDGSGTMVVFDMDVEFEIAGGMPPNVIFPHKGHTEWLHCNSCHPSPFIMKKGTNDFSMLDIFEGKYCGVCHNRVAFPFADCFRCHSKF